MQATIKTMGKRKKLTIVKKGHPEEPKIKLTKEFQDESSGGNVTRLARNIKHFKFAIVGSLDKSYNFKSLKPSSLTSFHTFVDKIVSRQMTITDVENEYLRTKGNTHETTNVYGKDRDIYHIGQDNTPFRIWLL